MERRDFLQWTGAAAALIAGCKSTDGAPGVPAAEAEPVAAPPGDPKLVRVWSVPTAVEGNVLPVLIDEFQRTHDYRVTLQADSELYDRGRTGLADLAISHYGHRHAEDFVVDGFGEFPRTIFSNQIALVGPPGDPAGVRGLDDAGEAMRRIAATKSPFVVNELDGLRYVVDILWHLAGQPERAGWVHDHQKGDALAAAGKLGAYTVWGLTPFLRTRKETHVALEPMVLGDPLFLRLMVSIVVKPKAGAVNVAGARAFQQFLLEPATQARMRSIDYSDDPHARLVAWAPAGRHNRTAMLPPSKT